ncbi:MAG: SDR family NAD(P)-dependent oxidoreductase [Dehalococcoidia bacterium]|nr:SDR family NAD(P)-dependent oxidoreductase [Dehalococcoidia bacterium]
MDLGLKGKNVIVTGGASNIGRAISIAFGEEGANVSIVDLDEENAKKVADIIRGKGSKALTTRADVTNYADVERVVKATAAELGGVDVLVNGVGWDDFTPFLDIPVEKFDKYLSLNLRHVLYFTKAVLPLMIEKKAGAIINISSDAGRIGEFRESIYSAAKGGVITFSKNIAREFGRYSIRCNSICPSVTFPPEEEMGKDSMLRGDMVAALFPPEAREKLAKSYPLRRLGKPQDIANMVVFAASERCTFLTGQTISVNGGYSML